MFFEICTVLSYSVLVFLIIAMVGYWTGANYYFKLNQDFVGYLLIFNAIAWFMYGFVQFMGAITDTRSAEWTDNFSIGMVGTINMCVLLSIFVFKLCVWFESSRKYFWSKRGR